MPTYCYTTGGGRTFDRVYPAGEAPGEIVVDGEKARRDFRAELRGCSISVRGGGRKSRAWPMEDFAAGVHASQAQELRDHFKKSGVPTEVTSDGDPIYTSHQHRKRALKCRGLHDKQSYC